MPKFLPRTLISFVLLFAGSVAMAHAQDNSGIHVSGTGEILVEPDMGRMQFQVTRQGRDPVALKKEMDQITKSVLELTDSLKIKRKDVTAAVVRISPNHVYENNRQRIDGVNAARTIEIVLRDLDKLAELSNRALELGINSMGGINLDSSKRVKLEKQALDAAIDDAKVQAAYIAKGFGVRLGEVSNVQAVGHHSVNPRMASMAVARDGGAESYNMGEMTIRRDISVTFEIGGQ